MFKKVFLNSIFLAITGVVLATAFSTGVYYDYFSRNTMIELREDTVLLAGLAGRSGDEIAFFQSLSLTPMDHQFTLMDAGGQTILENGPLTMQAAKDSPGPEFWGAITNGQGTDRQLSHIIHETYYHAVQLDSGNILRLAITTDSLWGLCSSFFSLFILLALAIAILCYTLSRRLTDQIAESINSISLKEEVTESFDEVSPLLSKIGRQKRQMDDQVNIMEDRLKTIQAITEDMREGLILLNSDGIILTANTSALHLLGDASQQYAGRHILQLTRDMTIINNVKEAFTGQSGSAVLTFDYKTVEAFINPVSGKDNVNGAILLFLDVTEKANAEQIRREFSANVSHELKTPLTSILGYSEIINSGMGKSEDIADFTAKINTEVKRLITLVNDIIKLSELDESTGDKQMESFNLLVLANTTVSDLAALAAEKDVTIEVTGKETEITANRNMVGELLFNLLENSIKNNRPGGSVTVCFERLGKETIIQVKDTGIGIAREHIDRVFERFYQVDKSRSKKTGGTGLGLSIVKHVAQYHNGHASIESEAGKGTTVTAVLKSNA